MSKTSKKIAIIGGGAAGLAAAVSILNKNPNVKINIYDAASKLGKSILKTGNGRCNFSNTQIVSQFGTAYNHPSFVTQVLKNTDKLFNVNNSETNAVLAMFDCLGLACQVDPEGRMYPITNKASSVVDVFMLALEGSNINYKCDTDIKRVKKKSKHFEIFTNTGLEYYADSVIVCVGCAIKNIKFVGCGEINFVKESKILGPVRTDTTAIRGLDGIRSKANVSLIDNNKVKFCENGEILFRKYGVSGIVIFNLSRFVDKQHKQKLVIDFFPEFSQKDIINNIQKRYKNFKQNTKAVPAKKLLAGLMLPAVSDAVAKAAVGHTDVKYDEIKSLTKQIKGFLLNIKEVAASENCQVSRGGVSINSINSKTLESNTCASLFFAGEAVDVDGPCGGYNLHWAWTSGLLAGYNCS